MLEEVCRIGSDPKVTCFKSAKTDSSLPGQGAANEDDPVSDEEEYDEDRLPVPKTDSHGKVTEEQDVVRYCLLSLIFGSVDLFRARYTVQYSRRVTLP